MSVEDDLQEVVAACRARLSAQADLEEAIARRRWALWRLVHEDGVAPSRVTAMVQDRLRVEGFSEEMIRASGVSFGSVRAAFEGAAPPR